MTPRSTSGSRSRSSKATALGSHIVRIIGDERAVTSVGLGKPGLRLPNLTAFVHLACVYLSEHLKADNATLPVRLVS